MILKFRTLSGISFRFSERLTKIFYDKDKKVIIFSFDDNTKERVYLIDEDGEKFCEFIARMIDSANNNVPSTTLDINESLRLFKPKKNEDKEED